MIIIFDNNRGDLFIINLFSLTTLIAPIVLYWLLTHSVSRGILRWRKVVRPSDSSPSVIRPQLLRPPPSRHMSVEMIFTIIILSTRFNYLCHNLIVDCNVRILGTVYTKELTFLRKIGEAPALRILYLRTHSFQRTRKAFGTYHRNTVPQSSVPKSNHFHHDEHCVHRVSSLCDQVRFDKGDKRRHAVVHSAATNAR